jgi:hypothetical protein
MSYACLYMYGWVWIYTNTCVYMYVYIHVHMHVFIYFCTHIEIHSCTYTYIFLETVSSTSSPHAQEGCLVLIRKALDFFYVSHALSWHDSGCLEISLVICWLVFSPSKGTYSTAIFLWTTETSLHPNTSLLWCSRVFWTVADMGAQWSQLECAGLCQHRAQLFPLILLPTSIQDVGKCV